MRRKVIQIFWILISIFIVLSVVYTSYKTLVQKDFIIIEQAE